MSRNHEKLKVFQLADELVVDVYRATRELPGDERFGLTTQIRRAAVSVPTNIVEGSARASTRDYVHFLTMALASASEVRYLLGLCPRLELLRTADVRPLVDRYGDLVRGLQALIGRLR